MFEVRFYTFSKRNNSTKQPLSIQNTSFNCDIRNVSNILNPSIELKHDNPTNFNYCFIQEFERYYFISNWTFNQGLWIASCTIDVLATYKTPIGNSTKYVLRSYSSKNANLIDNASPITAQFTTNMNHVMPYPNQQNGSPSLDKGVFVIGVLGNNTGGQTMYELLPSQFQTLISALLTTADGYDWGDLTRGVINSLMNPMQYITSCRWYPNEFVISGTEEIKCGLWGSGVNGYRILNMTNTPYATFFIPISKHPQTNANGKYMNLSPFTQNILDASLFGLIQLDNTMLLDANYIGIQIFVDAFSGLGTIKGYAENTELLTFNRLLFKKDVMFGVGIPLTSNDSNVVPAIMNTILGLLSETKNAETGEMERTPTLDFGSIGDIARSVNGINDATSSIGSIVQHLNGFRIHQIFRNQAPLDALTMGYPLLNNVQLNTLNGFILCRDGNIELSCTDTEKEKIKQYLEQGFYYE